MSATAYSCCEHCSCPDDATGHPAPCTRVLCGQNTQHITTPDQLVALQMRLTAEAGRHADAACVTRSLD